MGCKCSGTTPVLLPVEVEPDQSKQKPSDATQTAHSAPITANKTSESPKFDQTIDRENRRLPNSLIEVQKRTAIETQTPHIDFLEIKPTQPEAFNKRFIQQRQQAIDNTAYRSAINSWRPDSLDQLINSMKTLSANKSMIDSHWIIFYWIACNIEYDTLSYFSKNYADQTAEGVFRTKKGVCAGYANVYQYIADKLNLPCVNINGYSKCYGFDQRQVASMDTDHIWNAVRIDDHWYLVESTWGAGHLTEEKKFKRELNSYYFFPPPEQMIYHHLPENEKWQLLRYPIKMTQYLQMPKLRPLYFELNLDLITPQNQNHVDLLPNRSYAVVVVQASSDVSLIANFKLGTLEIEGSHRVIFDKEKQLYSFYFAPNSVGKHEITIYGKRGDTDERTYNEAFNLTLNIEETPKHPISFPQTWDTFFDLNLQVVSPKNTHLIKLLDNEKHGEILIRAPGDVEMLGRLVNNRGEEIEGGHKVFYDRHKRLWRCRFAPNSDGLFEAQVFAKKKSDTESYTSAVSFKIDAKSISTPPLSYPVTWQLFYDLDLKIEAPRNLGLLILSRSTSFTEILISAPDNVELFGRLVNNRGEEIEGGHEVFYDRHKSLWHCKFAPNSFGKFDADILAKKKSDAGLYMPAVSFKVDAKSISTPPLSYPVTWQLFYDLDLKIEAPLNRSTAVWAENASFTEICISAPDDVSLSGSIEYNGIRQENCVLIQYDHDKKQWQLLFAPQRTGLHKLIIFGRRQSDTTISLGAVAQFNLNVTKLRRSIRFPLTYAGFQTKKCRIHQPLNGMLKRDTTVSIHCTIPGANNVDLTVDSKWIEANGYKDPVFKTDFRVGSKDVTVYAKYGESSNFQGLFKYSVE